MDSFREKPSKKHVIWTRETRDGARTKRFDDEHFEKWARHYNFDFEISKRVDHDRGEKPRQQFRCVFAWGDTGGERFEFGDEEWELGSQETPRTFVEIDEEGIARVKGWHDEAVFDIEELRHEGPKLLLRTTGGERKRIDGRTLAAEPEP